MYDKSDPRASLMGAPKSSPAPTAFADPEYGLFYEAEPQIADDAAPTWLTRGQNFLVCYTRAKAGAVLSRLAQPDEYVVIFPDRGEGGVVEANGQRVDVEGYSLVIVPPGASIVTSTAGGQVVRIFSTQAEDLCALCSNAESYTEPHPNLPPFESWPEPVGGYKIRVYSLDVSPQPGRFGRIFRCSTLMVNFLDPLVGPRDVTKLSPHHHDDFEQGSLALAGSFIHHMRWPWTTNLNMWKEDVHPHVKSPSLTVIPPPAIHTSRGMDAGVNQLVDIFAPPREDFSLQPGWVLNGDEYPMPAK